MCLLGRNGAGKSTLLARALVRDPDVLHLDIDAIEWLEDFLIDRGTTLLFVTHDRAFLRRVAKQSGAGRRQGGVQKVTACNGGIETEISLLAGEAGRTSHRAIRGRVTQVRTNKNP